MEYAPVIASLIMYLVFTMPRLNAGTQIRSQRIIRNEQDTYRSLVFRDGTVGSKRLARTNVEGFIVSRQLFYFEVQNIVRCSLVAILY